MRSVLAGLVALAWSTGALAADRFHFSAGAGMPELLHGEVGVYVGPHVSIDARAASTVFNPVVGGGVTYLAGSPEDGGVPRHAMLLGMHAMVNPTLGGLQLHSSGDTIGAYLLPSVGYGFHARNGFTVQARLGAVVTREGSLDGTDTLPPPAPPEQSYTTQQRATVATGFGIGPDLTLSLGWAF